jgi:hypothetical protein
MSDCQRFVILRHEPTEEGSGQLHWDLMLEADSRLMTWALDEEPRQGATIAARQLPDHRPRYLTFEGSLSGGRGTVTCWDRGHYLWKDHAQDRIEVELLGDLICGSALLRRDPQAAQRWTVCFAEP